MERGNAWTAAPGVGELEVWNKDGNKERTYGKPEEMIESSRSQATFTKIAELH